VPIEHITWGLVLILKFDRIKRGKRGRGGVKLSPNHFQIIKNTLTELSPQPKPPRNMEPVSSLFTHHIPNPNMMGQNAVRTLF
jgi:hypothetical protein